MTFKSLLQPYDVSSEQNKLGYIFAKMLNQATFIELVLVEEIGEDTATVRPLVKSIDGSGNAKRAERVRDIPFFRLQMGNSAILMDPAVGDIGLMLVCDQNTHNVKTSKAESIPANGQAHSRADGVYLGGIGLLNGIPSEYIKFTGTGIKVVGDVDIEGKLTTSSTITAKGEITGNNIALSAHTHGGVERGESSTDKPE